MGIQIISFILSKFWWFVFFKESIHFNQVAKFMCGELFLVFPYYLFDAVVSVMISPNLAILIGKFISFFWLELLTYLHLFLPLHFEHLAFAGFCLPICFLAVFWVVHFPSLFFMFSPFY